MANRSIAGEGDASAGGTDEYQLQGYQLQTNELWMYRPAAAENQGWENNWMEISMGRWLWHRSGTIEYWEFDRYAGGPNAGKSVWTVYKTNNKPHNLMTGVWNFEKMYEALLPDGQRPPAW